MEHIVQLGVTIDDDAISKNITETITNDLKNEIFENVQNYSDGMFHKSKLEVLFSKEIKELLEQHKDLIIDKAIQELTRNMCRTKTVKEKLGEVLKGGIK